MPPSSERRTSMNKVLIAIVVAGLVVVGAVGLLVLGLFGTALTYCDLLVILAAAVEVGEKVIEAVRDFLDADPGSLVGDLPEDAQGAARAVIAASQAVVRVAWFHPGVCPPDWCTERPCRCNPSDGDRLQDCVVVKGLDNSLESVKFAAPLQTETWRDARGEGQNGGTG